MYCLHSIMNSVFPFQKLVKPIFHRAFFGRVGADNAIHFALGKFQIIFSHTKLLDFQKKFAYS